MEADRLVPIVAGLVAAVKVLPSLIKELRRGDLPAGRHAELMEVLDNLEGKMGELSLQLHDVQASLDGGPA